LQGTEEKGSISNEEDFLRSVYEKSEERLGGRGRPLKRYQVNSSMKAVLLERHLDLGLRFDQLSETERKHYSWTEKKLDQIYGASE
jgi:predicted transcriptional regulator